MPAQSCVLVLCMLSALGSWVMEYMSGILLGVENVKLGDGTFTSIGGRGNM